VSRKLELIREEKLFRLLPGRTKRSRLEASGVALIDDHTALVVFDNLNQVARIDLSLKRKARQPGISGRVMRQIVTKHRALYGEHLEAALVGMYEHLTATSLTLERFYGNPAIRTALRVRDWLRPRGS